MANVGIVPQSGYSRSEQKPPGPNDLVNNGA